MEYKTQLVNAKQTPTWNIAIKNICETFMIQMLNMVSIVSFCGEYS
jgi:hypothetical protein